MTPENTVFVALDHLSRKPNHVDQPLPEQHEFTGEALLAKADELIEHDHRLSPEQRILAREKFRELVAAHTINAPVLLLSLADDTDYEITRAAYATPEVWMYGRDRGDWALAMRQYQENNDHEWTSSVLHYSMWTFIGDVRNGTTRLLVGEEAVSDWLQNRSLISLHAEDATPFQFTTDINILDQMQSARMPVDYLGLTDRQRTVMGERLAAYLLTDSYSARASYSALEYVLGIDNDEQRNQLFAHVAEELAELLPATYTQEMPARLLGAVETLGERMPQVPGHPQGIKLREGARSALLLAHMYRHRSQMTFEPPAPLPSPQREPAPLPEYPSDHKLHMFKQNELSLAEVWQDIDFINAVGGGHAALALTEPRVHTLSAQAHALMMNNRVSLGDLPPVFNALEIVFNADTAPERHRLYSQILYDMAQALPVKKYSRGDLTRVVGIVEAILPHMPDSLRNYRGDDLRGPAEIAAIIADMYDYRASFYIQADITHTGEDADV